MYSTGKAFLEEEKYTVSHLKQNGFILVNVFFVTHSILSVSNYHLYTVKTLFSEILFYHLFLVNS